jgi:hypothetical protein
MRVLIDAECHRAVDTRVATRSLHSSVRERTPLLSVRLPCMRTHAPRVDETRLIARPC